KTNRGADCVPVAKDFDQVERDPLISVISLVPQYDLVPVITVNRDIHEAIVVKVAECSAPRCTGCPKYGATPLRYVGESALLVLQQQGRFKMAKSRFSEFDIIHHVSLRYEKVNPRSEEHTSEL